jgi:hypothetical protein
MQNVSQSRNVGFGMEPTQFQKFLNSSGAKKAGFKLESIPLTGWCEGNVRLSLVKGKKLMAEVDDKGQISVLSAIGSPCGTVTAVQDAFKALAHIIKGDRLLVTAKTPTINDFLKK